MNNALYSRIANRKVWLIVLMARFSKDGNFKYRMAQWMVGRYGIDELTQALMLLGCGFVLVNFFAHSGISCQCLPCCSWRWAFSVAIQGTSQQDLVSWPSTKMRW